MKLSEKSLAGLKTLQSINNAIWLQSGKLQASQTTEAAVTVLLELEEALPVDFRVYNMSQFIGNYSLFGDSPEIEFHDTHAIISDDHIKVKYFQAGPKACVKLDLVKIGSIDEIPSSIKLEVKKDVLDRVFKLALNNQASHIVFSDDGKDLSILAVNAKDDAANTLNYVIGPTTGTQFQYFVDINYITMIETDDYDMTIIVNGKAGVLRLKSKTRNLRYYIYFDAQKKGV